MPHVHCYTTEEVVAMPDRNLDTIGHISVGFEKSIAEMSTPNQSFDTPSSQNQGNCERKTHHTTPWPRLHVRNDADCSRT